MDNASTAMSENIDIAVSVHNKFPHYDPLDPEDVDPCHGWTVHN